MSKILSRIKIRKLAHIIRTDMGFCYYVDSANTFDHGYETMVFPYDPYTGNINYKSVFTKLYDKEWQMNAGHSYICKNFEKCIEFVSEDWEHCEVAPELPEEDWEHISEMVENIKG